MFLIVEILFARESKFDFLSGKVSCDRFNILLCPDIGDDPASCDFETSKCGYVDSTDNTSFTWTRHQGPTASFNTGPNTDHTTGTAKGS